jgi:hypothetical protein
MSDRTETVGREIAECIDMIEALGPDVAWSFGTITNDTHMITPEGRGVCVTINAPGTEKHPKPITVFQKSRDSFRLATEVAIRRCKRRQAGDGWA